MDRPRCAPRQTTLPSRPLDPFDWAALHFGGAELGDSRRTARLVTLAAACCENPAMSLPKHFPDWSDLTAAYRLLSNEQVDPQAILAPHRALTREQAAQHPVVLCVQDGTTFEFTCRTGIRGLGVVGDGQGRGLLQHGALAVLPDKRVLGVLDAQWHSPQNAPKGETRRQRQARWNLSDVWQDAATAIGAWPEGSHLIHVGDRQADLFRFMHQALEQGHGFVIRAVHDRYVDDSVARLWDKLPAQSSLGELTVTIGEQRDGGNKVKRTGRSATLTVRAAPVKVPHSRNDPRTKEVQPLELWAVHLIEAQPPEGHEPVEWMLLTSLPADTLKKALVIVRYYTCRWVIEEWHRCLKQGCRIEASQLDDAMDIRRLLAISGVQAIRLLELRDLADGPEGESSETLARRVPRLYRFIVAGLAKVAPDALTPKLFFRTIAKRGGWLGRKNDPRPGWIVLWRGWSDIVQMVRGAELYEQFSRGSGDV